MLHQVKPTYLVAIMAVVAWDCGGTGGAVAHNDGGPTADSTSVTPDAPAQDGLDGATATESGAPDGMATACVTPLMVQAPGGTGDAYFTINADGTQCSVHPGQSPDATLMYTAGPSGDFPTGMVWVPAGSPWQVVPVDGGTFSQGFPGLTIHCGIPGNAIPQFSLTLVDGKGDHLEVSVGCDGLGYTFIVFSVSLTT